MIVIQSIRYVISFLLVTGWGGGKAVLAALLGVRHRPGGAYDQAGREWGRGLLRGTGIRARVEGRERLNPAIPVVYISNHTSFIDIWAILAEFPGTIRFVYKKGMNWIPLLGLAMRKARHIPIQRQRRSAAFAAYDAAAKMIRTEGMSAVVFAEGTRSRDGRLKPFKKGPFVLAIAAGAPVLPVFCEHTYELMPRGSWSPRRGEVVIHVGTPISSTGMTYDDRDRLAAAARTQLLEMGARE